MSSRAAGLTALVAVIALLAACGDDDSEAASADITAYCDATLALDQAFGRLEEFTPDALAEVVPLLDTAVEFAPDEIAEAAQTLDATLAASAAGDFSLFESAEYAEADATVHRFDVERCGFTEIPVGEVDFAFAADTLPTEPGRYSFEVTNTGDEFHVAAVARLRDDASGSAADAFAAATDDAAFDESFERIGGVGAYPGDSDYQLYELEAGSYVMYCPIPIGSTAASDFEGDGAPHFTEGMVAYFEIDG